MSRVPVSFPGFQSNGTPVGGINELTGPQSEIMRAGYWTASDFVPLAGNLSSRAFDGNDELIVGGADLPTATPGVSVRTATIWTKSGTFQPITGLEPIYTEAWDVNNHGTYVGNMVDFDNPAHLYGAFIGRNGTATRLNFPGAQRIRAYEINDDGWFTGVWEPAANHWRGYIARHDLDTGQQELIDLGLYPGYTATWAYEINNDRTVVGAAMQIGGDFERALIWPNGSTTPLDLNDFVNIPGATLIDAYRINNAGQILAEARLHAGGYAYYRLDPVPEPAGLLIVAGAVAGLARRRGGV